MNDPLIDAIHEHEHETMNGLEEVNLRLAVAATDLAELRAELQRLDRDLDESRRLNRRAAELLDLVYEHLASNPARQNSTGLRADSKASVLEGEGAGI